MNIYTRLDVKQEARISMWSKKHASRCEARSTHLDVKQEARISMWSKKHASRCEARRTRLDVKQEARVAQNAYISFTLRAQ